MIKLTLEQRQAIVQQVATPSRVEHAILTGEIIERQQDQETGE